MSGFILDSDPVNMNKWRIQSGNGIWDQMQDTDYIGMLSEKAYITPEEVGDYSMYVKYDFSKYCTIKIYYLFTYGDFSHYGIIETKEIISTPEGSMLYFNEDISGLIEPGETYHAKVYTNSTQEFLKRLHDIEEYLK